MAFSLTLVEDHRLSEPEPARHMDEVLAILSREPESAPFRTSERLRRKSCRDDLLVGCSASVAMCSCKHRYVYEHFHVSDHQQGCLIVTVAQYIPV